MARCSLVAGYALVCAPRALGTGTAAAPRQCGNDLLGLRHGPLQHDRVVLARFHCPVKERGGVQLDGMAALVAFGRAAQ